MANQIENLVRRQHFGFGLEDCLEFAIVDFRIAGGHDQDASVVNLERQCLGDALRLAMDSLRRQLHGGAGDIKLQDLSVFMPLLEMLPDLIDSHPVDPRFLLDYPVLLISLQIFRHLTSLLMVNPPAGFFLSRNDTVAPTPGSLSMVNP